MINFTTILDKKVLLEDYVSVGWFLFQQVHTVNKSMERLLSQSLHFFVMRCETGVANSFNHIKCSLNIVL